MPSPYVATPRGSDFMDPGALVSRAGVMQGMRIADFGVGHGYVTLEIAKKVGTVGADAKVYAVDIRQVALDETETRARMAGITTIQTVWADLEVLGSTKIPDGSVDMVFIVTTVNQVDRLDPLYGEAHRITKTGGTIIVVDWKPEGSRLGPPQKHRWTKEECINASLPFHWTLADSWDPDTYHFALHFKKE